jgi:putative hydrolase of the HAD superfamily
MIKAVIFDLGNVLIPFDFTIGYRALEPLCEIPAAEIPARIAATGLVRELETGEISADGFYIRLADALNLQITIEEFREIWCSIFLPHPLIPEELLEAISRTHKLILLSNTNAIHFDMIAKTYPLLRHFHAHILSHEAGAMKPDPAIYRAAIAAAGCAPEECFFTDDLAANVEGARQVGMDAVQFESGIQLEAELRARGVV